MATDKEKQQQIVGSVKIGVTLGCILIGTLYILAPFPYPKQADVGERLAYAVRWFLPVPLVLLWALNKVGSIRYNTAAKDPLGTKDQDLTILPNKMVQNTMEQGLIYILSVLMLSTYLTPSQLPIIPALAINFTVGRLLFFWGYQQPDNLQRAYGFAMTFIPHIFMLIFLVYKFATEMILA